MTKRQPRINDLSDEAMACFVQWCRLNDERIVSLPELARRVLIAYATTGRKR